MIRSTAPSEHKVGKTSFLTDPGDLVLDPFGGSNTTGAAAEVLGRHSIALEPDGDFIEGSIGRFGAESVTRGTILRS